MNRSHGLGGNLTENKNKQGKNTGSDTYGGTSEVIHCKSRGKCRSNNINYIITYKNSA